MCSVCDRALNSRFYRDLPGREVLYSDMCIAARLITGTFLTASQNFMKAILYAGILYLLLRTAMSNDEKFLQNQCGIDDNGFDSPNTLMLTIFPILYMFGYVPLRKKQAADRQAGPDTAWHDTGDYNEIMYHGMQSAITIGYTQLVFERIEQQGYDDTPHLKTALYVLSTRGIVVAILLLLNKKLNQGAVDWYYQHLNFFMKNLDRYISGPLFNGYNFSSSIFAFVVSFIFYFINASKDVNYPQTYAIALVIALISAILVTGLSYVTGCLDGAQERQDASYPAGLLEGLHPAGSHTEKLRLDQKIEEKLQVVEGVADMGFFLVNFIMTYAVCRDPDELTAAGFKGHFVGTTAGVVFLFGLNIMNEVTRVKLPGLESKALPFVWPYTKPTCRKERRYNFYYYLRWSALNGFGFTVTPEEAVDAKSMREFLVKNFGKQHVAIADRHACDIESSRFILAEYDDQLSAT